MGISVNQAWKVDEKMISYVHFPCQVLNNLWWCQHLWIDFCERLFTPVHRTCNAASENGMICHVWSNLFWDIEAQKLLKTADTAYFCSFKHFSNLNISKLVDQNITNPTIFGNSIESSIYWCKTFFTKVQIVYRCILVLRIYPSEWIPPH